ncbi:MAG: hypothetical protein EOO68_38150 [Moraxellaceae bacterium]|nr:MAG: hypothetical protein EOO68_38150 [Moraxellaceae bacterium]
MHYFNDQLQAQARTQLLPKTGFYKVENGYWARFGSLTLGSHFHTIENATEENAIGEYSELTVRSGTGKPLSIDEIFNSLDNNNDIIHLDRLIRTLHSLNYLQQFDGQKGLLALTVQPRHIISVAAEHGKAFEAILSDCGLGPERVLLHTRLLNHDTLTHFRNALLSYKSRGYLIGISIENKQDLLLLEELALPPDVIFQRETSDGEFRIHEEWLKHFAFSKYIVVSPQKRKSPTDNPSVSGYLKLPLPHHADGFSHQHGA